MSIKDAIKNNKFLSNFGFSFINARIAYNQRRENADELLKIKAFKDIHKGKRCFIIGTGPSLTVSDLELLKNEITFAPNRIYELFDKTDWRPTYYINQDHNLINTFTDKIKAVEAENVFLPVDYKDKFPGDKYRFFVLKHKEFYPRPAPFSRDVSKFLAQGFTVTYGAIQLAVYMGFSEIYLIGIDHNYNIIRDAKGNPVRKSDAENNYPQGMSEYMNANVLPRVEETTIAYETAEKLSEKLGVKIYNATRGGKLEAFSRVDLDSVI